MSDDFQDNSGEAASDTVTEYSSQSWFDRIKAALFGMICGILLIPGSIWVMSWNEGRAVETARALSEGSGAVVDTPPDRLDPGNQGRLVHLAGPLIVPGTLSDPDYGVAAPGAAKLIRHVETFQWHQSESTETHNKLGGGTESVTTYRYTRTWSDTVTDSTKFKQPSGHTNPPPRVRARTQVAQAAKIGAFRLDAALLEKLGPAEPLTLQSAPANTKLYDGGVYLGQDPQSPAIGDQRITFRVVHPPTASVIAKQDGDALRPYTTLNGQTLLMISAGQVSAPAMFDEAKHENALITWLVRVVGAAMMFVGFFFVLRPFAVLASVLPFMGELLAAGAGLVALLATIIIAPLVIAIAWLAVRPIVGGSVLLAAAIGAILVIRTIRNRRYAASLQPRFPLPSFSRP